MTFTAFPERLYNLMISLCLLLLSLLVYSCTGQHQEESKEPVVQPAVDSTQQISKELTTPEMIRKWTKERSWGDLELIELMIPDSGGVDFYYLFSRFPDEHDAGSIWLVTSKGEIVDSIKVSTIYGLGMYGLNSQYVMISYQHKSTAAIIGYSQILTVRNGKLHCSLYLYDRGGHEWGPDGKDALGHETSRYDVHIDWNHKMRPVLTEENEEYYRDEPKRNERWSNTVTLSYDTVAHVFYNSTVTLDSAKMSVWSYESRKDTIEGYYTGTVPAIRLKRSTYAYVDDRWWKVYNAKQIDLMVQ
jgi:hypothetical protein